LVGVDLLVRLLFLHYLLFLYENDETRPPMNPIAIDQIPIDALSMLSGNKNQAQIARTTPITVPSHKRPGVNNDSMMNSIISIYLFSEPRHNDFPLRVPTSVLRGLAT